MATQHLTIGTVSRLTGLPARTIRFYEEEDLIPRATRSESGYRLYSRGDVWRLKLVRQVRALGVPLADIRPLISQSMERDCIDWAGDLRSMLARHREEIERRIVELNDLRGQITDLQSHVEHCECEPGQTVADCFCCTLLDEEGGESDV